MKHTTYYKMLEAFREGCPLCVLMRYSVAAFLENFLYECVNDPSVRKKLHTGLGFCPRHSWQLRKFGDGFGQAIIYADLLELAGGRLGGRANAKRSKRGAPSKCVTDRSAGGQCMVCKLEREAEERYLATFLDGSNEPELRDAYQKGPGLCVPHIVAALQRCNDDMPIEWIMRIESQKIKDLISELKEYLRKHDYRFSHEPFGRERGSWIRAIEKLKGKEGVF